MEGAKKWHLTLPFLTMIFSLTRKISTKLKKYKQAKTSKQLISKLISKALLFFEIKSFYLEIELA